MSREEEIKEAAQKYVGFIGAEDKITLTDAFKIGVEWSEAYRWHDVKNKLPDTSIDVIYLTECGCIYRGNYDGEKCYMTDSP